MKMVEAAGFEPAMVEPIKSRWSSARLDARFHVVWITVDETPAWPAWLRRAFASYEMESVTGVEPACIPVATEALANSGHTDEKLPAHPIVMSGDSAGWRI